MVHENLVSRLQLILQKAKDKQATSAVTSDDIDRGLAVELANIRSEITKQDVIGVDPEFYRTPQTINDSMELEATVWPQVPGFTSGQIDSSSTGDTVLLTGVANQILIIQSVYSTFVTGTTQAWRYEIDTGSAFGTTRQASLTNVNGDNKELRVPIFLTANERLVINVTTAIASSTIDWVLSYITLGWGSVWQV